MKIRHTKKGNLHLVLTPGEAADLSFPLFLAGGGKEQGLPYNVLGGSVRLTPDERQVVEALYQSLTPESLRD